MTIITVLLTILLILDCLLLSLLVLVQLPKKDAGVGMAFGGGAADALFGAGSGTALSNLTKYATGIFFVLVFVLGLAFNRAQRSSTSALRREFSKQPAASAPAAVPAASTAPASNTAIPLTITTNATTATPMTNLPAKK